MRRQGEMRRQGMCRHSASSGGNALSGHVSSECVVRECVVAMRRQTVFPLSLQYIIMYTRARPLGYPVAPFGISSRPWQVVEKVVEVPQVGSTTQGSVREEHVEGETKREEHPAQVVQQARHGQVSCDWDRLIGDHTLACLYGFCFFKAFKIQNHSFLVDV